MEEQRLNEIYESLMKDIVDRYNKFTDDYYSELRKSQACSDARELVEDIVFESIERLDATMIYHYLK